MTDPVSHTQPLAPHLAPMAEAMQAAEQAAKQQQAERQEAEEAERKASELAARRDEDAKSIRHAFARGGKEMALKVGRTYGWTKDEVRELFQPKRAPAPEPAEHGGGDDDGPPPPEGEGEGGDGEDKPKRLLKKNPIRRLPKDCPIVPLGENDGLHFYLSVNRQFRVMDSHSAEALRGLFAGRIDWLWGFMPKFKEQTGEQTNWDAARTADSLIDACGKRGPFNPADKLRGVGAWRGDAGELIFHAGDQVFDGRQWCPPGFIGPYVYPGDAPLPKPADEPADDEAAAEIRRRTDADIEAFLTLLDSWNWAGEFETDPETGQPYEAGGKHRLSSILMLGWMAGALVGGALEWRPMVWLTGEAAAGKSTLQKLIAAVMGASLVTSSDATAAGIYQSVGYSSRAAGIDEAEADPNSQKMKGMVELVRQSSSGGNILRGSNDPKKWRGFTARSSFLLSSIVIPPLFGQDLTRITILPLSPLPKEAKKPKIEPARWDAFGRALRRRLLDNWPRWEETLERYAAELAQLGHDHRGGEQIGGLLAMADLVSFVDVADSDTVSMRCAPFDKRHQPKDESTSQQFLNWLISKTVIAFRGGNQMTIGALVSGAAALVELPQDSTSASYAHALHAHGIFVEGFRDDAQVVLPNQSAGLAQLLDGSPWGTRPGAAMSGWQQAMQRLANTRGPDGKPLGHKTNSRKHGGRGWSLPARVFLRMEEE